MTFISYLLGNKPHRPCLLHSRLGNKPSWGLTSSAHGFKGKLFCCKVKPEGKLLEKWFIDKNCHTTTAKISGLKIQDCGIIGIALGIIKNIMHREDLYSRQRAIIIGGNFAFQNSILCIYIKYIA